VVHRQPWPCAKIHRSQNIRAPSLSWYSFGAFGNLSNPHFSKITNFIFSQNSPPSHLAMPWCIANLGYVQNPTNSTFVHQDFHGIHLGKFLGPSNPHISKITNFIFSQNSTRSHLAMPWCTANLGHVQNPPNSKLSCTKTFKVFIWGRLEAIPTITSQKSRISFFHKTPHEAIKLCRGTPTNLAMCKTHRTQNFRAPRLSWYSFGGIWRPIQPSHLKNHEFHFFTKLPTRPSSCAVVHRPIWRCAKPFELKTFVHQDFHGIHLGAFGGQSKPHISKTMNLNFSQNSPPGHLVMPWCTHQLGHVQNPPNSKLSCTKTFMVFIWGYLEANPNLISQKP